MSNPTTNALYYAKSDPSRDVFQLKDATGEVIFNVGPEGQLAGGGGTPSGPSGSIQSNQSDEFYGDSGLVYNPGVSLILTGAALQSTNNNAFLGTSIVDSSGNGIVISDTGAGGITETTTGALSEVAAGNVIFTSTGGHVEFNTLGGGYIVTGSVLIPQLLYSIAGTPLPTPTVNYTGARAVVSDASSPAWMQAYTGGGTVVCTVLCNGTDWLTV